MLVLLRQLVRLPLSGTKLLWFVVVCVTVNAWSQSTSSSLVDSSSTAQTISGRTINAVSGQPVGRVLIRYGSQAFLTDFEGRFEFVADGSNRTSLSVSKPGYGMDDDTAKSGTVTLGTVSSTPIEVYLYPESILTGTITSSGGDLLSNVQVTAYRSVSDESGHHWSQGATGRTNTHGTFRLSLQAGDYRLQTSYLGPNSNRNEAILPVLYPEITSSSTSTLLHLRSGETQRVDLQPQVRAVGTVKVSFEPEIFQRSARIIARASNGAVFPVRQTSGDHAGESDLAIPYGTYTLQARSQGQNSFNATDGVRQQGRQGMEEADTQVTVGEHTLGGVILRFAPVSPIPVELITETTSTSDNITPLTITSLGLSLENDDANSINGEDQSVGVVVRADRTAVFNPSPGIYRFHAQSGGSWFVRAVSFGTSDLLRQDLTVTAGTGSIPVRVIASNQIAGLSGVVRQNGTTRQGEIYLVPTTPSATAMMMIKSSADGSYARTNLPPGTYRVIAFERQHNINFQDPDIISSLSNEMQSITLNAGDKATLDLTITPFVVSH